MRMRSAQPTHKRDLADPTLHTALPSTSTIYAVKEEDSSSEGSLPRSLFLSSQESQSSSSANLIEEESSSEKLPPPAATVLPSVMLTSDRNNDVSTNYENDAAAAVQETSSPGDETDFGEAAASTTATATSLVGPTITTTVAAAAGDDVIGAEQSTNNCNTGDNNSNNNTVPRNNLFKHFSTAVDQNLRSFFFRLGYKVASHPGKTICIATVCAMICTTGLLKFHIEDRSEVLWTPQNSRAIRDREVLNNYFNELDWVTVIFAGDEEDGIQTNKDIATVSALLQMISILEVIAEQTSVVYNGETITIESNCVMNSFHIPTNIVSDTSVEVCPGVSVLNLFWENGYFDETSPFLGTVKAKISGLTDEEVKSILSDRSNYYWNFGPISPELIISDNYDDNEDNSQYEAFAYKVTYIFDNHAGVNSRYEWEKEVERNLFDRPEVTAGKADDLQWFLYTRSILADAFNESLFGDLSLLFVGLIFAVTYVSCALGHLAHPVKSRVGLALMSILSILLAVAMTFGIGSLLTFYGPVHQAFPLLMLAVGIDDTFVIVSAFDELDENMEIKERIARALSHAGTSVTVTTLTNSCAFFVGSLTETLALRYFAYWAGIGIIFDFLLQTTFFVACLTYDARRQQTQRCDVISCMKYAANTTGGQKNACGVKDGILKRFFEQKYAPFILSRRYVQTLLLSIAIGVFALCIYGTTQLKTEFDISYFYMPGSRAYSYEQAENKYFEIRPEISYFIFTGDFDYTDRDNQLAMNRLFNEDDGAIVTEPYYRDGSLKSWYFNFRDFGNLTSNDQTIPPDDYYDLLDQFLTTTKIGKFFAQNIVQDDTSGLIVATQSIARYVTLESKEIEVDAMRSLRSAVDSAGVEDAFAFSRAFIYIEGDAIIKEEAVKSALLSLTVVFVVTLVLVGHLCVASIVLLGVGFSLIDLLGFMDFFDINLNTVSVISLALAVGLTIDFSAHIGLMFMTSVGTKKERVGAALSQLGPALTHGGLTTILIIGVLGFSKSYVFNVFFKVILMIISLGLFHGMVIVPIVLHRIGPDSYFSSVDEARRAEDAFVAKMLDAATGEGAGGPEHDFEGEKSVEVDADDET